MAEAFSEIEIRKLIEVYSEHRVFLVNKSLPKSEREFIWGRIAGDIATVSGRHRTAQQCKETMKQITWKALAATQHAYAGETADRSHQKKSVISECTICSVLLQDSTRVLTADLVAGICELFNLDAVDSNWKSRLLHSPLCTDCHSGVVEARDIVVLFSDIKRRTREISERLQVALRRGHVGRKLVGQGNAQELFISNSPLAALRMDLGNAIKLSRLKLFSGVSSDVVQQDQDQISDVPVVESISDIEMEENGDHADESQERIDSASASRNRFFFSTIEVDTLLRLHEQRRTELNRVPTYDRLLIWREIAKEVSAVSNCPKTPEQCKQKIKNMRKKTKTARAKGGSPAQNLWHISTGGDNECEEEDDNHIETVTKTMDPYQDSNSPEAVADEEEHPFDVDSNENSKSVAPVSGEDVLPKRTLPFREDEIRVLVSLYEKRLSAHSPADFSTRRFLWEQIAEKVSGVAGIRRTGEQCRVKMKNVRKKKYSERRNPAVYWEVNAGEYTEDNSGNILEDPLPSPSENSNQPPPPPLKQFSALEVDTLLAEYSKEKERVGNRSLKASFWTFVAEKVSTVHENRWTWTAEQCRTKVKNIKKRKCFDRLILTVSGESDVGECTVDNYTDIAEVPLQLHSEQLEDAPPHLKQFSALEIQLLLTEYSKEKERVGDGHLKASFWERVAQTVSSLPKNRWTWTAEQCRTKVKNLKRSGTRFLDYTTFLRDNIDIVENVGETEVPHPLPSIPVASPRKQIHVLRTDSEDDFKLSLSLFGEVAENYDETEQSIPWDKNNGLEERVEDDEKSQMFSRCMVTAPNGTWLLKNPKLELTPIDSRPCSTSTRKDLGT